MTEQEYEQRKAMLTAAHSAAIRQGDKRRAESIAADVRRLNAEYVAQEFGKGGAITAHWSERK